MTTQSPRKTPGLSAFTLIELLVVVAIILILIAILLTGIKIAFDMRAKVETKHRINQIEAAISAYSPSINCLGLQQAYTFDIADYMSFLHIPEKPENFLRVQGGTWSPATFLTATHIKDGFGRPIWMQVENREVAGRPGHFATMMIAIRSYGSNDDPYLDDDIIQRFDFDRNFWEDCRMTGSVGNRWILVTK